MIILVNTFLISLFLNLSVSSYRLVFTSESKGNLSNSLTTMSHLMFENDIRTRRERRYLSAAFSDKLLSFIQMSGNYDRTMEYIGKNGGESRGGLLEVEGYRNGFLVRTYIEGRIYRKDSVFFNPGYGLLISKKYRITDLFSRIRFEYREFGDFKNQSLSYTLDRDDKDSTNLLSYSLSVNLRKYALPYGIYEKDNRFSGRGYGEVLFRDNKRDLKFSIGYNTSKSAKVASVNFKKWEGKAKGNIFVLDNTLRTSGSLQYVKKAFLDGGFEQEWNYHTHLYFTYKWFDTDFGVRMKRFDYFLLVPLDRDERTVSFNLKIMDYRLCVERVDINYIRSPYIANSRSMRRYIISSRTHLIKMKNIIIGYKGKLFAGIFTPIYSNDFGYYHRYWENRLFTLWGDSIIYGTLTVRYKQMGEFKNDSIFSPYEDVEYVEGVKYRIFNGNVSEIFVEQFMNVSRMNGIREWKIGIGIDTRFYTAKIGTGELMGRKNTYLEFSAWI